MSSKLGPARATALALLPLGMFSVGPVLALVLPDTMLLESVVPLAALVFVALASYRRTGSAGRALRVTSAALALVVVGAFVYLLAVWASASGS